jgi:hypothetical protein
MLHTKSSKDDEPSGATNDDESSGDGVAVGSSKTTTLKKHEKKTAWANIQGINSLHKAGKHTRLAPDLSQSLSSLCYI